MKTSPLLKHPGCDWAIIPDKIDGDADDNDRLLEEWPFAAAFGVPVWHLHESIDRLERLTTRWPRLALGSSGDFAKVGNAPWWQRITEAMDVLCDENGAPKVKIHGLRMLNPAVFTKIPFASADSTNVARNATNNGRWNGTYAPPTAAWRGHVIAARIEAQQGAAAWRRPMVVEVSPRTPEIPELE